jgi:hypothetical protein
VIREKIKNGKEWHNLFASIIRSNKYHGAKSKFNHTWFQKIIDGVFATGVVEIQGAAAGGGYGKKGFLYKKGNIQKKK